MTTPAQAYGHPDFVTDVATQGPTDPTMRAGSCWFAQNRVPHDPACVDCGGGLIPPWAKTSHRGGMPGLSGISFGGRGVLGFAFGAAGSPDIYASLTADQQSWIGAALSKLNDKIVQTTGTTCPGWAPAIGPASKCFQSWYNMSYGPPVGPANPLRTDGVFDEDTLCALLGITGAYPTDFPTAFPDPTKQHCQGAAAVVVPPEPPAAPAPTPATPVAPAPAATAPVAPATPVPAAAEPALVAPSPAAIAAKGGVNVFGHHFTTGEAIGIGAGVVVLGGLIYAGTRKRK